MLREPIIFLHDLVISKISHAHSQVLPVFLSLPLGWRRFALDVYPYADVTIMGVVAFWLMSRRSLANAEFSWAKLLLSVFAFAVVGAVMAYEASLMFMAQSASHTAAVIAQGFDASEVESVSPFIAMLPLDLVFGWTRVNATALLTSLNPVAEASSFDGIKAYQAYLWGDCLFAIPLYVYIHTMIMNALYTEEEGRFFYAKVPVMLGALDMFENIGHLTSTYSLSPLSEMYLTKLMSASHTKFLLFLALLGLEVSGLIKTIGTTVSEEIQTSGLTAGTSDSQKKGEEKRKARLEKKAKNVN
ncbi:hypothetical protein HDU98_009926 [Podochytrium sp. JEL0797]|nr:hypothetical protein HDU98_009926 [Podochytrium sp. JEL0797]